MPGAEHLPADARSNCTKSPGRRRNQQSRPLHGRQPAECRLPCKAAAQRQRHSPCKGGGNYSRKSRSALTSATSICAFCRRPEWSQFMACQRVNWSSTHIPDCREPLPDLPLPPKGRCASAPDVELFTDTMPAETRSRKRSAQVALVV